MHQLIRRIRGLVDHIARVVHGGGTKAPADRHQNGRRDQQKHERRDDGEEAFECLRGSCQPLGRFELLKRMVCRKTHGNHAADPDDRAEDV